MNWKYEKNFTEKGYLMKYEDSGSRYPDRKMVYQFRIELRNVEPLIWRRIQVPSGYNFWDLHVAVQDSMGWQDSHLHHFDFQQNRACGHDNQPLKPQGERFTLY